MKKKLRDAWVKALRSGKYKQTTGQLKIEDSYCCLGVLCEVSGKRIPKGALNLDVSPALRKLRDECGLGEEKGATPQTTLTDMNDDQGKSFKQIARWIETNVPVTK